MCDRCINKHAGLLRGSTGSGLKTGGSGGTYDPNTDTVKVPGNVDRLLPDFGKTIGASVKERTQFEVLSAEVETSLMALRKQLEGLAEQLSPAMGEARADSYGPEESETEESCFLLNVLSATIKQNRQMINRIQYIRDRLVI